MLRFEITPAANSNNGSGTLYYRNLTDGDTSWQTGPTGVNLAIQNMTAGYRSVANWNAFTMRDGSMDNSSRGGGANDWTGVQWLALSTPSPIPEPSALMLVGIGMLGMIALRRFRHPSMR